MVQAVSIRRRTLVLILGALLAVALAAPAARAASRVYWANYTANKISYANLDGSGGGDTSISGGTVNGPIGVTFDPANGRLYWANYGANKISYANLDGSGGGDLSTSGATVSAPSGVSVDQATGRIYWANQTGNKISYANLDGSGGGDLSTSGATVSDPTGVAVDATAGRVYWANQTGHKISYANLDGSGGADLSTTGATTAVPVGVAVEPAAGRIYWANASGPGAKISYAALNGSGGGDLVTTGATGVNAAGVAVDVGAGRVYWANQTGTISFAAFAGSGAGDLAAPGATLDQPNFPILLKTPEAASKPQVSGGSSPGATLTCNVTWDGDVASAFLFRAARTMGYQWTLNGADIPGATQSSYLAASAGQYGCRATATNVAGSSSAVSDPHPVVSSAFTVSKPRLNKKKGTATLRVSVPGPGKVTLSGKFLVAHGTVVSVGPATVTLTLKAKGKGRTKLGKQGKLRVSASIGYAPVGGAAASVNKAVVLKLQRRRRGHR